MAALDRPLQRARDRRNGSTRSAAHDQPDQYTRDGSASYDRPNGAGEEPPAALPWLPARTRLRRGLCEPRNWLQLVKFCLVGASGYLINLSAFALATELLSMHHLVAATVAFVIAVTNNFWLNRTWTFAARESRPALQATRFFALSMVAFLIAAAILELLVSVVSAPTIAAQAASIVAATPFNFIGNKIWCFSRRPARPGVTPASSDAGRLGRLGPATPPELDPGLLHAWLVLPTYNEAENLEPFVRAVLPQLASCAGEHRILVVDDSSPDGTGEVADRLADEFAAVDVLHRPEKDGLGRAYLAGFERALDCGAELVIEMDSDFSHDPADLPRLIAAIRDVDLVLGSRYVAGGEVANWGLVRRVLSRAGSWYARTILRVPVRDLTGGFKCFRRGVLERVRLANVETAGYAFQVELTYRAVMAGCCVREVPICFRDRQTGVSKMNVMIALEALWRLPALKLRPRGWREPAYSYRY